MEMVVVMMTMVRTVVVVMTMVRTFVVMVMATPLDHGDGDGDGGDGDGYGDDNATRTVIQLIISVSIWLTSKEAINDGRS